MLTNEELDRIEKEAEIIQKDPNSWLTEKKAALDLWLGARKVIVARMERNLIEAGHGDAVAKINKTQHWNEAQVY